MQKIRLTYAGDRTDQFGMPDPYFSYLIATSKWKLPGSGVASIFTTTDPPPGLEIHHVALRGGEQHAADMAEEHLNQLHRGLRKFRAGPIPPAVLSAWIAVVFPSFLEGLSREELFLRYGSLTWRFRARRCEYISLLQDYLGHEQLPLYEQFFRYNPTLADPARRHDDLLRQAEAKATELHNTLVAFQSLDQFVARFEAEFAGWRGAFPAEDGRALLAECVVNWSRFEAPEGYTTATPWRRYRQEILQTCRQNAQIALHIQQLEGLVDSLRLSSNNLHMSLVAMRARLADEHGVPPVDRTALTRGF